MRWRKYIDTVRLLYGSSMDTVWIKYGCGTLKNAENFKFPQTLFPACPLKLYPLAMVFSKKPTILKTSPAQRPSPTSQHKRGQPKLIPTAWVGSKTASQNALQKPFATPNKINKLATSNFIQIHDEKYCANAHTREFGSQNASVCRIQHAYFIRRRQCRTRGGSQCRGRF